MNTEKRGASLTGADIGHALSNLVTPEEKAEAVKAIRQFLYANTAPAAIPAETVAPVRIWIDCEFNEFKGALISMALVPESGPEFYEVLDCPKPGAWVAEHVMPILNRPAISMDQFHKRLSDYLARWQAVHIIADWPEDIAHFCQALITGPGERLNTPPLTLEVIRDDAPSDLPHNALEDARGMRRYSLAKRNSQPITGGEAFQQRVQPWMMETFGAEIAADTLERSDRFIEEALELVQAGDYPKERAHQLVEYVYNHPQGEINQEVGGVMVTLAALCLARGVDMHHAAETELTRIWTKVDQIRAKQAAKPRGSALPVYSEPPVRTIVGGGGALSGAVL